MNNSFFDFKLGLYGQYNDITFDSTANFPLLFGKKYIITGTNATGKTTLCEQVIYPDIANRHLGKTPLLHIGQDLIALHFISKHYYKETRGVDLHSFSETIHYLIERHYEMKEKNGQIIFIIDELDLHFELSEIEKIIIKDGLSLIFVSHTIDKSLFDYNINLVRTANQTIINFETINS